MSIFDAILGSHAQAQMAAAQRRWAEKEYADHVAALQAQPGNPPKHGAIDLDLNANGVYVPVSHGTQVRE